MEDLIFAWKTVKHAKSNGIAIAKDKTTTGIGPGQVSRIWALENAYVSVVPSMHDLTEHTAIQPMKYLEG